MRSWAGVATLAAVVLSGCVPAPSLPLALDAVRYDQIPGWTSDSLAETFNGLRAECRRLAQLPPDTSLGGQGLSATYGGKAGQWAPPCLAARELTANDGAGIRQFYEGWFQPYRVRGQGLFTGYYEPEVPGALIRGDGYTVPLLARPTDLIQKTTPGSAPDQAPLVGRLVDGKLTPYWTRSEIEAGAIGADARPLLWLASASDLFFLQLQGAGRVRLPDGRVIRVAYDGKNGRAYTPIGGVLVAEKAIAASDVSMQSIKAWLAANPARAKAIMDQNDDYVFFRPLASDDPSLGPPGALGVSLTPGRSAAVDPHYVALGSPIFVDTIDPTSGAPWRHLLLAQDSGTDIKGAARTDIFFGFGPMPEQAAGHMHQAGSEFLLLPRPVESGREVIK